MTEGKADVLIVDGEPGNLRALATLLEPLGQHLLNAQSGAEALQFVLTHQPVVILLDVSMTGDDGLETARALRQCERSRRTPIICLTGASKWPVPALSEYGIGAVDYVLKPVIAEILRFKVSVFIELHREEAARAAETRARELTEVRLQGAEAQVRALTARLSCIRDEERNRIAREIHDELGQVLTSLKMHTACLERQFLCQGHPARARTERMRTLIDSTVHLVQRISAGMRPEILEDLGLAAALRWQAREFERSTGIRCRPTLPGRRLVLDAELCTAVFRSFQEILTNVARHARANSVKASLEVSNDWLLLEVKDDGIGIAQDRILHRDSLGLLGMRERAQVLGGELAIGCSPGHGTRVTVRIPLRTFSSGVSRASQPPCSDAVDSVPPMCDNAQSVRHGWR